jgi:hypothetical protein
MSITLTALQKQRRDTAANWTSVNPTLLAGEIGIESDTNKWKVGTGSAAWTALAYMPGSQLSAYPIVNVDIAAGAEIAVSKLADGTARQLLQTDAAGTGVEWASNIDVPGTLDVTSAATFDNNVIIQGDLTVNGTETIINTQTLDVEDKNIVIGKVVTPSDVTADGGGITLKGTTDKTINWIDATDAWTFSEHVNIVSTKEYRIAGTKVLDATSLGSGVTSSSLTSVGTIATGVWNGTAIGTAYGGTGQTTYTNGQLLIGKTDGTLAKATLTASTGVTITNADGSITISATGSGGTVTSVTGTSPIASTGGATPDISIQDGTTTQKGAVQLEDSTSSTSTTKAATPASVKAAYDLAVAALPKAGGVLTGDVTLDNQFDLRFREATANGTNYVGFQAPATVASDVLWTLPAADGTAAQVLSTNGSGTLSWATATGGGASVTTSDTAPSTPADGDLWYDSVGGRTYVYYDDGNTSQWVDAAPQGGAGTTPTKIEVGNTKAEVTDTGSNGTFTVTTEGTGRLSVDSSGRTLLGGVTANANGGILQLTSGITFPATAVAASDANTLDDYEEGTWTPNINSGYNQDNTVTYTAQNGTYTKIGRLVVAAFHIDIATWSGNAGPVFFGGLPFTPATTTDARFQCAAYLSGPNTPASTVSVNLGYAKADNGSYYLVFNCVRDDTAMANAGMLVGGNFAANDIVAGTFTFFA